MNWGGFGEGFSRGYGSGVAIGKSITDAVRQKKIEDIRKQGIAEAQAMQQAAIDAAVTDNYNDKPAAPTEAPQPANVVMDTPGVQTSAIEQPQTTVKDPGQVLAPVEAPAIKPIPADLGMSLEMRKRYSAGGKDFDTREQAVAQASKKVPSIMDYMGKTLVPRMQQALIESGDVQQAEAWGKWADEQANQRKMKTWAKAYTAAQLGNMEAAAEHVFELYKDFDDGVTPVSKEVVKDKDGNVTGFNVKLKDDATGEERAQFIEPQAIVNMGLSSLSPPAMFEQAYRRQNEASALAAKARIDEQNDARTYRRDMARQGMIEDRADKRAAASDRRRAADAERQHGYKLEEMATEQELKEAGIVKQERAKVQSKVDLLRDNGMSPDAIREMLPHMVGGDGYKKATDPTERRAIVVADLMKNDPSFAREKDKTKQDQKVSRMMEIIYGSNQATKPAGGGAKPASSTKKSGTPVYDSKTGTIVYR